jgi:hypothetical protein
MKKRNVGASLAAGLPFNIEHSTFTIQHFGF